jgi:hypothetical protein
VRCCGLQYGAVQGYLDDGVNVWRGVPYAAPPVGQFRLREPQDALAWEGVREAYEEAPICPQIHVFDWLFAGEEDCLYADIYTPATQAQGGQLLPVFVWIYGGAWIVGDAYEFGQCTHGSVNSSSSSTCVARPLCFPARLMLLRDSLSLVRCSLCCRPVRRSQHCFGSQPRDRVFQLPTGPTGIHDKRRAERG